MLHRQLAFVALVALFHLCVVRFNLKCLALLFESTLEPSCCAQRSVRIGAVRTCCHPRQLLSYKHRLQNHYSLRPMRKMLYVACMWLI
jgi:hypothetical protein